MVSLRKDKLALQPVVTNELKAKYSIYVIRRLGSGYWASLDKLCSLYKLFELPWSPYRLAAVLTNDVESRVFSENEMEPKRFSIGVSEGLGKLAENQQDSRDVLKVQVVSRDGPEYKQIPTTEL